MNAELCKQALERVGNPNILVNIISRRVRQLTSGGGSSSRPAVDSVVGQGLADIALRELIEDKLEWELLEPLAEVERTGKKKKK